MKSIESVVSFLIALAGVLLPRRRKRNPPCCPYPYPCPLVSEYIDGRGDREGCTMPESLDCGK